MSGINVDGIDEALTDIDKALSGIKNVARAGLWEAGLGVMNSAQKRLKNSVITGNLRASGYVRSSETVRRPDESRINQDMNDPMPSDSIPEIGVEMGFTALYALYAHENMEGRAPKFLENAISENKQNIISIIKKRSEDAAQSST